MGFGIARAFAQTGARVAIDGRTLDRLEGTLTKLEAMGVKAMAVPCDVRNPQAVEQAFEQVEQTIGLLALGSEEPPRFYPEMGTLFLTRFGGIAAAALLRTLG